MNNTKHTRRTRRTALAAAALLAVFIGNTPTASAAAAYWTGANGANWSGNGSLESWSSSAANPGVAYQPINGDTLEFRQTLTGGAPTNRTMNNDLVGLSVANININSGSPTGYNLSGNKLTLTSSITGGGTGNNTINLPLELSNGITLAGNTIGSGLLTISGNITETGGARTVNGQSGNVALYGANEFSGNIILGVTSNTTWNINTLASTTTAQSLGKGSLIQFGQTSGVGGTLIYDGSAGGSTDKGFRIGRSLVNNTGTGSFINNGSGAVTWTGTQSKAASNNQTLTFTLGGTNTGNNNWQSVIANNSVSGIIALTKTDAGKWILGGNNTYTGNTTVSAGTLLINGSTAAGSAVSVAAGATLGGNGTVGGATTLVSGGILSPGNSPGTLAFSSNLTLTGGAGAAGATAIFEGGDLVNVNGTLTLDTDWNLTLTSGFQNGGTTTLFNFTTAGVTLDLTPDFDITGLGFTPSSSLFLTDTGSSIVLNGISVVPEPSTWALLAFSLTTVMVLRRRRH